jgi:hypothetical protein
VAKGIRGDPWPEFHGDQWQTHGWDPRAIRGKKKSEIRRQSKIPAGIRGQEVSAGIRGQEVSAGICEVSAESVVKN